MTTHTLRFSSQGSGPPVVLLHSSGLSSQQWRRLGVTLGARARVIAPDFLGSGANPPWPRDAPFELRMDLDGVRAILHTLDRPAHLVGHSYGAFVALALARLEPARVASLALYEPTALGVLNPVDDADAVAGLMHLVQTLFHDAPEGAHGAEPWCRAFTDYWGGAGVWDVMPAETRSGFLRAGRKVALEVRELVLDRTAASEYARVAAPTLLMSGECSPHAPRRIAERLAAAMPAARLLRFASAGHLGPITHAAAVNHAIDAHLRAAQ